MLEKIKDQENKIMLFFVVILIGVGSYVIGYRNVIDYIYFGVMLYYFISFLRIKNNGK